MLNIKQNRTSKIIIGNVLKRFYSSAFHQDHVIECGVTTRKYLVDVAYMRNHLKSNTKQNAKDLNGSCEMKIKHEQNISLLLNTYNTKWNDITLRSALSLLRRKLVACQQSFLRNDRTILSSSNIKQSIQGSTYYLNNPNERKIVLSERENMIQTLNRIFREAKNLSVFSNEHCGDSNKKIAFDVHVFNMFMDIYLRLREVDQIWELERHMEKHKIQPNLSTLIFLTDACRIDNQIEKVIQYYRKAITQWSDCIELDTSYWNHLLSALALIGTDSKLTRDVATNSNLPTTTQDNELLAKYFSIMIDSGYTPDEDTFRFVILGSRNIHVMMETLDIMENQYGLYYLKCYESISLFLSGHCYEPSIAVSLFHRLVQNRSKFKDARSTSAFLHDNTGFKVIGTIENVVPIEDALEYKHGLSLDLTTVYQHLMHALIPLNHGREINLDMILAIYDHAVTKEKLKPTASMMEDLVDAYSRAKKMKEAWVVLSRMRSLKLFKNNSVKIHWKMLMAYRHSNDLKGAATVMKDAIEYRVKMNDGFVKLFMDTFSHSDEMAALVIFCSLIDSGFINIVEHRYYIPVVRDILQNIKKKHGIHKQQLQKLELPDDHGDVAKLQRVIEMLNERGIKIH